MEQKHYLGDGNEINLGNNSGNSGGNNTANVLNLFKTPNKFGASGKEFSSSNINKKNKYGISKYKK
jgi:hypothetical protein